MDKPAAPDLSPLAPDIEPPRALRFAASGTLDFTYCTGLGKMLMSTLADDDDKAAGIFAGQPVLWSLPGRFLTGANAAAGLAAAYATAKGGLSSATMCWRSASRRRSDVHSF